MKKIKLPKGWDEKRVGRVVKHYETQTDEAATKEDEAARKDGSIAYVAVPRDLVDEVQDLIRRRTGTHG